MGELGWQKSQVGKRYATGIYILTLAMWPEIINRKVPGNPSAGWRGLLLKTEGKERQM